MHEKGSTYQNADTETVRRDARCSIYNCDEVASKRADSRGEKGTSAAAVRGAYLSGSRRRSATGTEAGAKAEAKKKGRKEKGSDRIAASVLRYKQRFIPALNNCGDSGRDYARRDVSVMLLVITE